jgi:hypothetical protein
MLDPAGNTCVEDPKMRNSSTSNGRFLSVALAGLAVSIVMVVASLSQAAVNVQAFI